MLNFYDMNGRKISLYEWSKLYEGERKRVAETKLICGITVSTILLGLDHNSYTQLDGKLHKPIIFESMVFHHYFEGFRDLECKRYHTKLEALRGHELLVREWRKKQFAYCLQHLFGSFLKYFKSR